MTCQRARGFDRRRAIDLDDLVDHRTVEDLRNEPCADALDLVRGMLATRQYWALLRFHRDHPQRWFARFEHLPHPGDGAAGADASDKEIDVAAGIVPDFLRRGAAVN